MRNDKYMNKNNIKIMLRRYPAFFNFIRYVYTLLKYPKRLAKKCNYGKLNDDKKLFVVRPDSEDGIQGLMSLFIQSMRWIEYANKNKYISFVDYKNYKTQYWDNNNVWEYYFTQPGDMNIDDIYKSKNVYISGVTLKPTVNYRLFSKDVFFDKELCLYCYNLIFNNINFSEETKKIIEKENEKLRVENSIGVYIRGTDYVKLKPTGEFIQPDIDDVIKKIDEFILKYRDTNIFLVTEDYDNYIKLKEKYKNRLTVVSYDSFVTDYSGENFLSKSNVLCNDRKKRGMDYLVKIVLLSKCKYLISSITMGSIAAYCFNGGKYKDSYIFDLGIYK